MTKLFASTMFTSLVPVCALLAGACAGKAKTTVPPQEKQFAAAVSPPSRLDPPESLPPAARALLKTRMNSHARDMAALVDAIMVLNYRRIQVSADGIVADVSLARPFTGDATELNSMLPEAFFQHQDALKVEAGNLSNAAASQSAFAVAEAYGKVSQTCVRCHAAYREGR